MPTEPDFHSSVDTPYMDKVVSGAILYTENTKLSDEEKRIARQNIDAAAEGQDFTILGVYDDISELPETTLTGDAYAVKIPPQYRKVTYLESTGTQYIDAGVVVDSFDVDFQFTQEYSGNTVYSVLGSRTAENTNIFCVGHWAGSLYMCPPNMPVATIDLNRHHVQNGSYFENQAIYDETVVGTYESYDVTEDQNIYLFSENRGPTYPLIYAKSSCRIYSAKLYANGVLVRDFEPCYRTIDNVPGLLDKVNDVFYTNNGTGTFLVGSDIEIEDESLGYTIYIYDGVNHEWVNYGQLSPGLQVIDSASNDLTHTLSSAKTNQVFGDFMATSLNITSNPPAVTADKIQEEAVSGFYPVTISKTQSEWIGEEVTQYLSPDGITSDYTINDHPSSLNKVEFLPAALVLEPNVDYTYTPGTNTGTIHFRELPAVGSQTYAVTYNSTHPPFHRTVSIPGILSTDKPIVNLRPSNTNYTTAKNQIEAWKEIYSIVPIDNGLIVRAYWYINTSIPIAVRCIRK